MAFYVYTTDVIIAGVCRSTLLGLPDDITKSLEATNYQHFQVKDKSLEASNYQHVQVRQVSGIHLQTQILIRSLWKPLINTSSPKYQEAIINTISRSPKSLELEATFQHFQFKVQRIRKPLINTSYKVSVGHLSTRIPIQCLWKSFINTNPDTKCLEAYYQLFWYNVSGSHL